MKPLPTTTRFQLGRRWRRAVLVLHIVATGGWIGMDLVLAVLSVRAWIAPAGAERAVSMQALELFGVVPMITLAVLSLLSGILLGLGTKYGLLRYWWVAIKLAINLGFTVLLVLALRPGLNQAGTEGRRLAAGTITATLDRAMAFPVLVSLSGLAFAVALSVVKPWGRIRPTPSAGAVGRDRSTGSPRERPPGRWAADAP